MPYSTTTSTARLVPISYESSIRVNRNYLMAAGNLGGTSRMYFNVMIACNQVQFLFSNTYNGTAGETNQPATPGPITISGSMEDPLNPGTVLYQLQFGGNSSVTLPVGGYVLSDPVEYDLVQGQVIWLRTFVQGIAGQYFPNNLQITQNSNYAGQQYGSGLGFNATDSSTVGNNYVSDGGNGANALTTSGTAWLTGATNVYANTFTAIGVLGIPTSSVALPCVGIVGDSRSVGFGDLNYYLLGQFARAMRANNIPYISLGAPSETMNSVGAGQTNFHTRMTLSNLCTHVIVNYGINDINGSATFAQLQALAAATYARFVKRGIKVYAATLEPNTTSGSTYTSTGLQTPAAGNGVRVAWNTYLRQWNPRTSDPVLSMLSGVFDVASAVEVNASNVFTINGGYWYCGPGNNTAYTGDGLHGASNACVLMAQNILTSAFQYGLAGSLSGPNGGPYNANFGV